MRALWWLLAIAALAVGLSLAARYNDGYALLVMPPWRMELSLNLLLLLLGAAFVFTYAALRLISAMVHLPAAVRAFRVSRARMKGEAALHEATQLLIEGRYGRALKRAEDAWNAEHAPGLAALLALRAAKALRDDDRQRRWQQRAMEHDGEVHNARLMMEASFAIDTRDFGQAKMLLDRLAHDSGRHIAALRLSLRTQQGLGNWHQVLHLVKVLEKHRAMSAEQSAPLRMRAHRENLKTLDEDGAALEQYLLRNAGKDRLDPRLAGEAAQALIRAGSGTAAARLIEEALEENWSSSLAACYADCRGADVLGQIAQAEQWLQSHSRDTALLLTLGRLCQQRQLWGKAQSYLEASLAIAPSRAAHAELAGLLEHLEKTDDANKHYRAAALI
jgi:HemY protein